MDSLPISVAAGFNAITLGSTVQYFADSLLSAHVRVLNNVHMLRATLIILLCQVLNWPSSFLLLWLIAGVMYRKMGFGDEE